MGDFNQPNFDINKTIIINPTEVTRIAIYNKILQLTSVITITMLIILNFNLCKYLIDNNF